ncbi:MAG: type II secretion system protein [Planctomycetes bacterium]|nr:type II secretion system protein [Planctomycetota bacterium]
MDWWMTPTQLGAHGPVRPICRAGFTATELAVVISIILILASTGAIVTLPMLRRAAFGQAVAHLEDVARQAQMLARGSRVSASSDRYGVVILRDVDDVRVAITYGPASTWGDLAVATDGQPLKVAMLGPSAVIYQGATHAVASPLPVGAEVSWIYDNGNGRLAVSTVATLAPVFVGVSAVDMAAANITDGVVHVAEALSLRSPDQRQSQAIAVYSSGALASCPVAGL